MNVALTRVASTPGSDGIGHAGAAQRAPVIGGADISVLLWWCGIASTGSRLESCCVCDNSKKPNGCSEKGEMHDEVGVA